MPTELKSSAIESAEALPQQQAAADFAADVSVVLDALGRIETAARADRAALERLRGPLAAMAAAIGRAKAALAAGGTADIAALLDELEHRTDTMIEAAGGGVTAVTETAEPADVPTVSRVVSQLGPALGAGQDAEAPAVTDAARGAVQDAAVSELKAMLEAMNASAAATDVQPDAAAIAEASSLSQTTAAPETAAAPDAAAEVLAETPPPSAAIPGDGAIQEDELLASFERMGAVPILPPEEGTAVIFERSEPASASALPAPPEISAGLEPDSTIVRPEPALEAAPAPVLALPAPVAVPEAVPEFAVETAAPAAGDIVPPDRPAAAEPEAAREPGPAIAPPEPEFDLNDFLFGPEADPDPAAFLLEPLPNVPAGAAITALPEPDFVSAAAKTPHADVQLAATGAAPGAPPPRASRLHDPLHALKAMSDDERLALFS